MNEERVTDCVDRSLSKILNMCTVRPEVMLILSSQQLQQAIDHSHAYLNREFFAIADERTPNEGDSTVLICCITNDDEDKEMIDKVEWVRLSAEQSQLWLVGLSMRSMSWSEVMDS